MKANIKGLTLAVLGGDKRDLVLVEELGCKGCNVKVFGLPIETQVKNISVCNNLNDTIQGVQGILLPMPGVNNEGKVYAPLWNSSIILTEKILSQIPKEVPIFLGVVKQYIREMATKYQLKLVEIAEDDELAILNSIPSAEGAIQYAMMETEITIHGSKIYVMGFGRVGQTLSRMLKGIGANVFVAIRSGSDRARVTEAGFTAIDFERLPESIDEAQIIFNTVPQLIIEKPLIDNLNSKCVIIDLASLPGGTDFNYCNEKNIKALLLPGLPGKVAPVTAGKILSKVLPEIIARELILN